MGMLIAALVVVSLTIIFGARSPRQALFILLPALLLFGVMIVFVCFGTWKVNGVEVSPKEGWNVWSGDSSHLIVVKKENPGNVALPGMPLRDNTAKLETPLVVFTSRGGKPPDKPGEWQEYLHISVGKFVSEMSSPELSDLHEKAKEPNVLVKQRGTWINGSGGDVTVLTVGHRVSGVFVAVSVAIRDSDKSGMDYLRHAKMWMVGNP